MKNSKDLEKIKGDASFRTFYRNKKRNSIFAYAKKEKKKNLLIYDAVNKILIKNRILAPNLMGNICKWKEIREIADKHNLIVIEDSADTLGAKYMNKPSGYYSDMSITSFYGSHIINCAGNGGALMINDDKVMEEAKLLRSWGRSSSLFDEKRFLPYPTHLINENIKIISKKNIDDINVRQVLNLIDLT